MDAPKSVNQQHREAVAIVRSKQQALRLRHVHNLIALGMCSACGRFCGEVAIRIAVPGPIGDLSILCGECDTPNNATGTYDMELEMIGYYRTRMARNDYGIPVDAEFIVTLSDQARARRGLDVQGEAGEVPDVPLPAPLPPQDA